VIFVASVADPECLSSILDSIFVHPGSKNSNKRVGCPKFFGSHKNHKIEIKLSKKPIPDPGVKKKAPDPGSRSATLVKPTNKF
jgi:hypothetical protein